MTLEKLLNILCEKGWKPRGYKVDKECMFYRHSIGWYYGSKKGRDVKVDFTIRQLVSKESGLRQFVCESGLITKQKKVHDFMIKHITYSDETFCGGYSMENPEYYLMICALHDEHRIEQFLFDNIKI